MGLAQSLYQQPSPYDDFLQQEEERHKKMLADEEERQRQAASSGDGGGIPGMGQLARLLRGGSTPAAGPTAAPASSSVAPVAVPAAMAAVALAGRNQVANSKYLNNDNTVLGQAGNVYRDLDPFAKNKVWNIPKEAVKKPQNLLLPVRAYGALSNLLKKIF